MSPLELSFLAAGVGAVGLALLWRALARRRARTVLRRALADPDPTQRRVAVQVAARQGLGRHAKVLLDLARREEDPVVLRALADEVVRNQWEPDDQRRLVELRLWASRHVEELGPHREAAPPTSSGAGPDAGAQQDARGAQRGPQEWGEVASAHRNGQTATSSADADRVAEVLAGWSLLWSQGARVTRRDAADDAPETPADVADTASAAGRTSEEIIGPPKGRRRRKAGAPAERQRWG